MRVRMTIDFNRIIDRRNSDSLKWSDPRGTNAIPMWVADMDFAAPECVIHALRERVDQGVFGYSIAAPAVQQAVVDWAESHYRWRIDPAWIVWLPGLVPGIHLACRALLHSEDEILTLVPVYPPFLEAPRLAGRVLQTVPLTQEKDRWVLDVDELRKAIHPRTKLLLFCSPHNPVGKVFGREELLAVAEICERHDLLICSDEIHCDLILDPARHVPFASLNQEIAERTVTLMSPSKTFNLSGLSCGFAVIPNPELRKRFKAAASDLVPQPNALGYVACRAAYEGGEAWRVALIDYLRANRDLLASFFAEQLPRLKMSRVEATYLAWIDARCLGEKSAAGFFEKAGVRLSEGDPFQGPGFVRLNFACPRPTLRNALERISAAVRGIA
jgi:cysteine-S-conjugate beta-lyase